jgi:hypothetical protein
MAQANRGNEEAHEARRTRAVFGGKYKTQYLHPIPAKRYLLLTGTPIPNRIDEISTLVKHT